jgi:DNA polymerase-3 subunit chi
MTTTVQFYHLLSTSRERAVPSLMQKALAAGNRVVMLLDSEAALKTMSDALWSADPNGFLPHGSLRDGNEALQPIFLSLTDTNPNSADLLCVLDGSSPASLPGYRKVLDVIDGNNESAT